MSQYKSEVYLSDYLRILKGHKAVIITFFFITVLTVTIGSFLAEPVYRATVTLLVDVESPNMLTTTDSISLGATNYYAYKEYFQSQKEIIKSRSIARQVFKELKLGQNKDYLDAKDPIKKFLGSVEVELVRDTRLLWLHVDNKDPRLAADIANRIAVVYVARNLSYITKNEVLNLLKNEYLKLQTKISEYSKIYKPKHPKMIRLKQEMEQMVAKIKEEKERVGGYELKKSSSSELIPDTSSFVLRGLKANNITIQDPAEVPASPFKPRKRLNILLSIIVGLFGGLGLAFFFEYLDDTVKDVEDIERLVKWPFLGYISVNKKSRLTEVGKALFVQTNPKDPIAEAYRTIRTSVLFSSTEEYPLKTIVITSPGPKEGKTTTLCNLGITMAKSQNRVLLIDADMRKSRLHDIFKKKNDVGLSNFLSGQAGFEDIIKKTNINNLFLVCGGLNPPNPSELLASCKIKELIDTAKAEFDFIVFDTPPMAVVTDAVILSQVADGTIVVLESRRTNRKILPRIAKVLEEAKVKVIGIILNKVSITNGNYHYYSHYYYRSTK